MIKTIRKIIQTGDKLGKNASLESFSSFSMSLDAENELMLTGRCILRSFSDTEIVADYPERSVSVHGTGLYVKLFSDRELSVSGEIVSITFEKGVI